MACCNSNENYSCDNNYHNSGFNYVIILVLYILLAIIIGSAIWY